MKKRIISIFLSIMVCFLSFYFVCPVDVLAAGNNKGFNWETMDRDKWGPGKSYEECTEEEKSYRTSQLWGQFFNDISKGVLYLLNIAYPGAGNLAADGFSGLESYLVRYGAIRSGATTYTEYLFRQAGLGYLLDKDFGDDMPTPGNVDMTFSPDLLNYLQDYIDETNDKSSPISELYCYDVDSFNTFVQGNFSTASDDTIGRYYNIKNFCIKKMQAGHYVWWATKYYSEPNNTNVRGNYSCLMWTECQASDCVIYVNYDNGTQKRLALRRKDNQPLTVNYVVFDNEGSPYTILQQDYEVYGSNIYDSYLEGYKNASGVPNYPYRGMISSTGMIAVYKSAGHMSSAITYGVELPPFIQSSGAANTVYDSSVTITGDQIKNYDYSTVINNIGDTTGMNAEELQQRIDEVMGELGAIGGSAEDISHNTELQVSVLHKILDKLDDIYDKIGSGGGGVISDIADFVHWSELQLKLDAIIANLSSIRKDVDDISDNQSDMDALLNKLDQESQGLANKAKSKFPFCIPWDMLILYKSLEAMPQVPTFNWTLTIPSWGIEEEFTIDLSKFEIVAKISRYFFDIIFFMALCKLGLSLSGYSFSIEKT